MKAQAVPGVEASVAGQIRQPDRALAEYAAAEAKALKKLEKLPEAILDMVVSNMRRLRWPR
jgi:hypothetical protein